ncbi:histidine kinase [Sphingomonas piscis]|uniref:histidine kinase n=1 Tax=Sphingomonas piscis TaxID=2714943 RepID=A0A6G7YSI2_9SPHN|nr:PAS domain-containing sensor histidine kinase [Sphingomonas piscis]QIK79705.1 histidine kinase [Sphingomonas piscis]
MTGETTIFVALGLAFVWLAVGVTLALVGARRVRDASRLGARLQDMRSLVASSPSRAILIHPGGGVEADPRLIRELGFETAPKKIDDLAGDERGLASVDGAALISALRNAAISGERVEMTVRVAGSSRILRAEAGPAPAPRAPGTMLLWLSDVTAGEEGKAEISRRLGQTEAALNSLTHLIEAAPFPMWYRNPELELGLVNSAFVAAVEARDAADVIGRGIELVDGAGSQAAREAAKRALANSTPDIRMQPAIINGERRMLRVANVPLPTGAVAGFAVDVQDLEDARSELARHIQSQRELADHMTAGAIQFDADRTVNFYNRPFAVLAQLDPEWLSDQPEFDRVLERMRDNNRLPETRDFPAWKEERRGWFTSAEEVLEEEWILPNGDHLRLVAQPIPDGGLRMFLEDRTEQVRLASARDTLLRVRAATFDNLFESIAVFASDGRLYLWNRRFSDVWDLDDSWLSEHPRVDELVPAMARKLVNPTAAAQIREVVRQTTNERKAASGRISMTDGRYFQFAAVPLPDGNALLTFLDVTDSSRIEAALRERAAALEEADRVKTDFVANMSYELRTPLTSIGGFAEMIANGYAGELSPTAEDYVKAILDAVARLSRLVDDVLDLTTGDARGVTLDRERVDVGGLCRTALQAASQRSAEKSQKLEAVIDPSTGYVTGDARRLRESMEHVLYNAVAYTDPKGTIRLEAKGDDTSVTVTIADNGSGIPAEDMPRVFDRFHRVAEANVSGEAALGLGLPLTRQFIEAHGGTVQLDSEVGKGTRVTMTIPRGTR